MWRVSGWQANPCTASSTLQGTLPSGQQHASRHAHANRSPPVAFPRCPDQDIGKTLAQLNITVEAAVNAGLLGGLSASGALLPAGTAAVRCCAITVDVKASLKSESA